MDANPMNKALIMIKELLDGKVQDVMAFSVELEETLAFEYDILYAQDPVVTEILCEELPEICAEVEPGQDYTGFIAKVKEQYDRAMKAHSN